jgi:osmotically-inducible protein OsmY
VNANKGMPTEGRPDTLIAQNVLDVLSMGGRVNISNVSVECIRGVVTLDGTVVTPDERQLAERIAQAVPGVTRVINRIVAAEEAESAIGRGVEDTISPGGPSEP